MCNHYNDVLVEFHSSLCLIKDKKMGRILIKGKIRDGLCYFEGLKSSQWPTLKSRPIQTLGITD